MIFDVLKASSNHVKVQGWEWADMFVVCICVLQWLHIGEVIVCVCALQWFRMSFDHWVSAVCLCGPLPIGVNFSYLKWRQCGEEKRCYGVLKQEVWSGETLCERCRLKHFWHPPHWSTVTVLLWLGCQKWQTHLFFLEFCDPHMWKKKGSSKWALLKHVTHTNSIGTCSSELYIFSLLKLPPPPRAAILVVKSTWLLAIQRLIPPLVDPKVQELGVVGKSFRESPGAVGKSGVWGGGTTPSTTCAKIWAKQLHRTFQFFPSSSEASFFWYSM